MNRTTPLYLAVVASLLAVPAAQAAVKIGSVGQTDLSLEGLLQADGNWFSSDQRDLGDDRLRMRRAELVLKGDGPGPLDWTLGWDAKAEKFLDTNVRARWQSGDLKHSLRVGQFKQPNSLEELSSTGSNDFIAKATATSTYAIGRRLGVGYELGGQRWGVSASVFGDELTNGLAEGNGQALRGWWLPHAEAGNTVHLGINHARYDLPADTLRLRARPNADLADVRLIDTGRLPGTDRLATTGVEALWLAGPWKLQAEYFTATGQRQASADFDSHGGYASAVYNLGGHAWSYSGGVPSPPKAGSLAGGLWQLGARYDQLDLDDGAVAGGRQQALTLGVNYWYGAHSKFALNWVKLRSERFDAATGSTLSDDPDILEARIQLHW